MTCWLKLPLSLAILAAMTPSIAGCTASTVSPPLGIPPVDDGGGATTDATTPVGTDAGNPPSPDDAGTTHPPQGTDSAAACSLPSAWSQNPACDACQLKNCCTSIQECANDPPCASIYDCQSNCYSGLGPDGGALSTTDGPTAEDQCASDCVAAGSAAAQTNFAKQDTCVNTTFCTTPCQ